MDNETFIDYISERVNHKIEGLKNLQDENFKSKFYRFIAQILKYFSEGSPLNNDVVQLIDFVELRGPSHIFERKF